MIRGAVNLDRYKHKLSEADVTDAIAVRVGKAFQAGYVALVQSTPIDTGFLRASWSIDVGTEGANHVNPPDYELKQQIDNRRQRGQPSGIEPSFVKSLLDQIKYSRMEWSLMPSLPAIKGTSSIVAVAQVVYQNDAPYAGVVDARTGFSEVGLAAARVAIKTTASKWRMELRRR